MGQLASRVLLSRICAEMPGGVCWICHDFHFVSRMLNNCIDESGNLVATCAYGNSLRCGVSWTDVGGKLLAISEETVPKIYIFTHQIFTL